MEIAQILPFIAGIASFLVAGGLVAWISKQPSGTKEMMDISNAVKEGAAAFLKREMNSFISNYRNIPSTLKWYCICSRCSTFSSSRNYLIKNYSKSSS